MSCVCGMTFLCGSTLIKAPLLQAVAILTQMFEATLNPNKQTSQSSAIDRPRVYTCILWQGGVSCPVSAAWYTPVWQHIGQSITATSRHRRDMTSDVWRDTKPQQTNKPIFSDGSSEWLSCLDWCAIMADDHFQNPPPPPNPPADHLNLLFIDLKCSSASNQPSMKQAHNAAN